MCHILQIFLYLAVFKLDVLFKQRPLCAAGHLAEVQAHFGVVGKRIQRLRDMPLLLSTLHNPSKRGQVLALAFKRSRNINDGTIKEQNNKLQLGANGGRRHAALSLSLLCIPECCPQLGLGKCSASLYHHRPT